MGDFGEEYFDEKECPFCKSKKMRAIVSRDIVIFKDGENYWESETDMASGEGDVKVICCNCKEVISE